MAQRQERESSDEWELVAANDVQAADALKQEGNALFQQRKYLDAVQVYARALALVPGDFGHLSADDAHSLAELEVAVRLNRAFAYLQLEDTNLLTYAEDDCSFVLAKQAHCVKALYRRAVVRERLGKIKEALDDGERMLTLEPANPAALELIARLQESWAVSAKQTRTADCDLARALDQSCTISDRVSSVPAVSASRVSALDAWTSLQDEEQRLRREYLDDTASKNTRKAGKQTSSTAKNRTRTTSSTNKRSAYRDGEVLSKTESIWATLVQEEASTVAGAYKTRTRSKTQPLAQGGTKLAL